MAKKNNKCLTEAHKRELKKKKNLTRAERSEREKKRNRSDTIAVLVTIAVLIVAVVLTVTVPIMLRSCDTDDKPPVSSGDFSSAPDKAYGDFTYAVLSTNEIAITGYTGSSQTVTVPSTIEEKTVVYIFDAFCDNTSIREVYLPDTVTELVGGSFYGCTALSKISFYNSMTDIDANSFKDCTSLTTVEFYGTSGELAAIRVHDIGNEPFRAANAEYKNLS